MSREKISKLIKLQNEQHKNPKSDLLFLYLEAHFAADINKIDFD